MQLSEPSSRNRLALLGHALLWARRNRHIERLVADWETTPGKLQVTRIVLVVGVLLAGTLGANAAANRMAAISEITQSIEPLNADVATLYRALADANATVTSGFLAGGTEPTTAREDYDESIQTAAKNLAEAGARGGTDLVTTDRIADITTRLPVYTGLIEQARANNRQNYPVGVAYLQRASTLMQSSILPEAEKLRTEQADRLDEAYQRAGTVPALSLGVCAVILAGLIWAQIFLYRRTRRVFNIGLVATTGAVLVCLLWWIVAGMLSASNLKGAVGHSESVTGALAPAQIAALQARATESVALVARNGNASAPEFDAKMQLLIRDDGAGGALGAARLLATDPQGQRLVYEAIGAARDYYTAHQQVRKLDDNGNYTQAVDAAVGQGPGSSASAFDQLDDTLGKAVDYEREAFNRDIKRAEGWLLGLFTGTVVLAVVAVVGIVVGIHQRLEDYR